MIDWAAIATLFLAAVSLILSIVTYVRASRKVDAEELHRLAVELKAVQTDIAWIKQFVPPEVK
jgi:hypothetical protein